MRSASKGAAVTRPNPFSDLRAVVALATLCALLWGSAVPGVKIGYLLFGIAPADTPSLLLFAGIRFTLAGVLLLGFSQATGRSALVAPVRLGPLLVLGLISTAGQYLFYYVGLAHTSGVKVSITTSTSTFFSVLLAHFLYAGDKLTPRRMLGVLLGFVGVVVVNLGGAGLDLAFNPLGEGFIVIAAVLFSVAGIYGKRLSRDMDVMVMTGWQLLLGGLVLAGAGLALGGHMGAVDFGGAALIVYLAALSAAAFALWSLLLKHNPVGRIAIFNTLIPVFGVTLSALFLGENLFEWKNLVALALVSVGIWLATSLARRPEPVMRG
jgi:drug/metabolite transporter (DMT)-like permease